MRPVWANLLPFGQCDQIGRICAILGKNFKVKVCKKIFFINTFEYCIESISVIWAFWKNNTIDILVILILDILKELSIIEK